MSDDFAVERIVPSTRDLFGAVATRRKGLALVPLIDADFAREAVRLERLDVRAFALADWGANLRAVATATAATPSLCLRVATSIEDCQRARFYGADGVAIGAVDAANWLNLSKVAQSMHMMPFAACADSEQVRRSAEWGARAVLVPSAAHVPDDLVKLVVVVHGESDLPSLSGQADAAVVPPTRHARSDFEQMLETLDS